MKSYNSINIIKVIISICLFLILFSCSSRKILLDFPPYTDELPQIQTGYYSVYETENGIPSDTTGNEFLGKLIYLYKTDFLQDGKYFSGIKGSFLPNNYIKTKLVNGENVYYWYDAVDEEKSGEIIFSTITETKLFAQIITNSKEKINVEFRFYGNQLKDRPLKTIPIAHRGVCYQPPNNYDGIFPANTFHGFESALVSGYKGFELDVRVTKDKRFIISHDEDLSAATSLRGFVRDKNLKDFENALVLKSAAIPENKATAAEAFIAAPMKSLYDVFYHFIDDPRLKTFVVDVKPDSDENILAAAKHDFEGLSVERQKKVLFLTRSENTAKIFKDLCPYSDIAIEGSMGTEPVDELDKYFPEAVGLPRHSHNTISFGSNWILAFKSVDTSIEQIKKVMDNAENFNYKVCMWTYAKEDRLNFLRENNFYPDFILCDVPYYQFALQNLRYANEKNIQLPSKDEILIKYKNPIYKRVYKEYLTDFWFQSRNLIELSYGMTKFSNSDLDGSFANAGKIELQFGRSELDKFSKTNALLSEWYLMFAYRNSEFGFGNAGKDDINTKLFHFGVGQTEGLGYYGAHISLIPYISQSFIWSKMDEYSGNSNIPLSTNDQEILNRYKDSFRFGDRVLYGIKFDVLSTFQITLNYETGVIYPRTLFLKWAGSFLITQVGYNALNLAAGKWVDNSPVLGPIVNMVVRTGYLYAYYALRKNNMNWPFKTETPLRYEGFNFALSFVL